MADGRRAPTPLRRQLLDIYQRLYQTYGPQGWWPGHGPFETIVGAILTQNTAWRNVELALANLKGANAMSPARLRELSLEELGRLIRPSGYFNTKAKKLKAFAEVLGQRHRDSLEHLFTQESDVLRRELLSIYGIGEETADAIMLYAAHKPSFVIDAYTRRIMDRLDLSPAHQRYAAFQAIFHDNLPQDVTLFNEYHALLDRHAKETCRNVPLCESCCLLSLCPTGVRKLKGPPLLTR